MPNDTNQKQPTIVFTDAPDIMRAYSNHINITWNAFDVRLHFGESDVILDKNGNVNVQTKAVLTVSWTEAKQITEILNKVIKGFETLNGPIKRVDDIQVS
jgi:hypothetical protein